MTATRETLREAVAIAINDAIDTHGEFATGSMAEAALSAIEAAGWRIVPVEPTPEMVRASAKALKKYIGALPPGAKVRGSVPNGYWLHRDFKAGLRYRAMLAAAPRIAEKE